MLSSFSVCQDPAFPTNHEIFALRYGYVPIDQISSVFHQNILPLALWLAHTISAADFHDYAFGTSHKHKISHYNYRHKYVEHHKYPIIFQG